MIRTLVVDDEQPARERLRQLLAAHADVEVVGEAGDGVQAVEAIAALQPDLVLLDIQMPGASGLDVAASLGQPRPAVIFCTAYEQWAVDAFEVSATDYLLKPVNRTRLASALDRVRQEAAFRDRGRRAPVAAGGLTGAAGSAAEALSPTRFLARRGARVHVVPATDVVAFVFRDGITHLVTANEQFSMQPTLVALARRLSADAFFQVSRNAVIRLDAVREVRPFSDGTGEVVLAGGQTLLVARRRWRELLDRLEAV
jgi:two-component system LytT family response regulator